MRGISNVVSAIFVLAAILIAAYVSVSAYIQYTTRLAVDARNATERVVYAGKISFSDGICDTNRGTLSVTYTGIVPAFAVRFICYSLDDPVHTACVVPEVNSGAKSIQYVDREFPGTIELNISACADLNTACYLNKLRCAEFGIYGSQKILVSKS